MENETQQPHPEDLSITVCPSFSCYSSGQLLETASRVAAERDGVEIGDEEVEEEEFEFAFVRDEDLSRIGPVFPVFNRDLAIGNDDCGVSGSDETDRVESSVVMTLGKLFLEDREKSERENDSCSSSEADELENIPAGTYCVWRRKEAETPSPSRCKKSKSTGSASKRWKFRDFMRRSNSDGKDSFVFLTPKQKELKSEIESSPSRLGKGKAAEGGGARWSPSAHEALYVRNRAVKEGNRNKSYLPYRKDLVGFFANVGVLGSKSFPHF